MANENGTRTIDIQNGLVGNAVVRATNECACGCGRTTRSVWFPGHDALMHAQPKCVGCGVKRISATRDMGLFCGIKCAAAWAAANGPTEATIAWSVPQQAWQPVAPITPTPEPEVVPAGRRNRR